MQSRCYFENIKRIYCAQHASHIASDPLKQIISDLICQEMLEMAYIGSLFSLDEEKVV